MAGVRHDLAFVWRRTDFRESSRIVTLLSRTQGKVRALAKGAHRPSSLLLGRLDHLNLVEATLSGRNDLKLLSRCKLLEDRRRLRDPRRFLAASWLVELVDVALPEGRAEPELFDLVRGGLHLLELCPGTSVSTVVLGLELRFLASQGLLPPLKTCALCPGPALSLAADQRSLRCVHHEEPGGQRPAPGVLPWLAQLEKSPGRRWPDLPPCADPRSAERIVGGFVALALERRPRLRRHALDSR